MPSQHVLWCGKFWLDSFRGKHKVSRLYLKLKPTKNPQIIRQCAPIMFLTSVTRDSSSIVANSVSSSIVASSVSSSIVASSVSSSVVASSVSS